MNLVDPPLSAVQTQHLVRFDPPPELRLDFTTVFGNAGPVELEIGSGRGRFLCLAGYAHPASNFLGIEYARRYYDESVDRLGKRGITNVRLLHREAFEFLKTQVPDSSIAGIHIYFPDPWPKKRHHKRRSVRREMLDELARIAIAGSFLRIATDHPDYALVIRECLDLHPAFATLPLDDKDRFWDLPGLDPHSEQGVTNFEIKYRREGRPIWRFLARRR